LKDPGGIADMGGCLRRSLDGCWLRFLGARPVTRSMEACCDVGPEGTVNSGAQKRYCTYMQDGKRVRRVEDGDPQRAENIDPFPDSASTSTQSVS
jgi:hypothetical protein